MFRILTLRWSGKRGRLVTKCENGLHNEWAWSWARGKASGIPEYTFQGLYINKTAMVEIKRGL